MSGFQILFFLCHTDILARATAIFTAVNFADRKEELIFMSSPVFLFFGFSEFFRLFNNLHDFIWRHFLIS